MADSSSLMDEAQKLFLRLKELSQPNVLVIGDACIIIIGIGFPIHLPRVSYLKIIDRQCLLPFEKVQKLSLVPI
ncbi:hypothetical protein TNCT_666161 [Trichonephila clavata]|uniref:Uncharacterized protein n=1 Tax=Trichonephila clavata TaxID=2740835 RepID=A0A8X6J7R3_TRICU|nr:hypothetical protein TNCT_666161 [Trichonephila clavata]